MNPFLPYAQGFPPWVFFIGENMQKIPECCIAWFCLLACIKNPDKCPEYYLSMFGIYEKNNVEKCQQEHLAYINKINIVLQTKTQRKY